MARFYFAPNGLIVANNASHDAPFSIEQNDGAIMLFAAKENCENEIYVPSYAVIDVKNTVRVYGSAQLIDWQNGAYDVIIEPQKYFEYAPPVPIAQNSTTYNGDEVIVTIYKDTKTRAIFECSGGVKTVEIPPLSSPKISFSETKEGLLLVISGTAQKQYVLVMLFDGGFRELLSVEADDVSFSYAGVIATEYLKDMLSRVKSTTYSFSGAAVKSKAEFSYLQDRVYPDELIPYLFLESLAAKDFERATACLAPDIRESPDVFLDYFKPFDEISPIKHQNAQKISDLKKVALISYSAEPIITPRVFDFTVKDGFITDIN